MRRITRLLAEHGPMTARDLAREMNVGVENARAKLGAAKALGQVYIASWRRDSDGGRLYPRAVWAAGDKPDAPRPGPLTRRQYWERQKQRLQNRLTSVFDLAVPAYRRRVPRKQEGVAA